MTGRDWRGERGDLIIVTTRYVDYDKNESGIISINGRVIPNQIDVVLEHFRREGYLVSHLSRVRDTLYRTLIRKDAVNYDHEIKRLLY